MAKLAAREITVKAISNVTRNMRRVTFAHESLAEFPPERDGGYIKLMFENPEGAKPSVRTYTIRHHRHSENEIDVDFVMHADEGIASQWAQNAQPGDSITIGGPGPQKTMDQTADWFFLVGDMASLPALSANLERLPSTAKGHAIVELLHEEDKQEIKLPTGIELEWLVTANSRDHTSKLMECVRSKQWLNGRPFVWAASEFDTMKTLRSYFKVERSLSKQDTYFSSYWKDGLRESEHRLVKQQDAKNS